MEKMDAEQAIRKTAAKEGLAVEEIRKEMEKARKGSPARVTFPHQKN
jgi:hypothetical protein